MQDCFYYFVEVVYDVFLFEVGRVRRSGRLDLTWGPRSVSRPKREIIEARRCCSPFLGSCVGSQRVGDVDVVGRHLAVWRRDGL